MACFRWSRVDSRVQRNKFWHVISLNCPSFPRLPRAAAQGRPNNRTRPIVMTIIRNEEMESGYFFPKGRSRYVQWMRQIAAWLGYLLLIVILFIIFPIFCFIVALITCPFMMLRGYKDELVQMCFDATDVPKILLARYRRSFEQREREWDYEMGKPVPLPQQRIRCLSQARSQVASQTTSPFLTKLPVELRLQIYKYVIIGKAIHVHVAVHWTRKSGKPGTFSRIHGHPCNQHLNGIPISECRCSISSSRASQRIHAQFPTPEHRGRGHLALSQTCTQVYRESIDLLYSE